MVGLLDLAGNGGCEAALEDAQVMAGWEHGGGFSVDTAVRIERVDRDGLERLLRYCATDVDIRPTRG